MSVVMSSPVTAMHQGNAVQSYRTPAIVGGAVLAIGAVASWIHNYATTVSKLWPIQERMNKGKKIGTWCLHKYAVNKPIEPHTPSATFTNNGAWRHDQFDYSAFDRSVYPDLIVAYNQDRFGLMPPDYRRDESEEVRIQNYLYDCIQKEKSELEGYLDTLAEASGCISGWFNVRKTYKQIVRQEGVQSYDQTEWSKEVHDAIGKAMNPAVHTGLLHLIGCKPMYGRVARLYWDLLQRYYRLKKIEQCLVGKLNRPFPVNAEEEAQIKLRSDKHKAQDQTLSNWLWYNTPADSLYKRYERWLSERRPAV